MTIKAQLKAVITTQEQRWSAINTFIITLILITPLCGLLFQCGCDWPWTGLDSQCNFYKPHAQHQCPWCASLFSGILSTGLAVSAGVWAATMMLQLSCDRKVVAKIGIRTVFGVIVFVVVAVLSAGIAAFSQAYTLGLGSYL